MEKTIWNDDGTNGPVLICLPPKLNTEQLSALQVYSRRHGRCWKSALRLAWENGNYTSADDISAPLQQVRNTFGPSWLVRFRLPK